MGRHSMIVAGSEQMSRILHMRKILKLSIRQISIEENLAWVTVDNALKRMDRWIFDAGSRNAHRVLTEKEHLDLCDDVIRLYYTSTINQVTNHHLQILATKHHVSLQRVLDIKNSRSWARTRQTWLVACQDYQKFTVTQISKLAGVSRA